MVETRSAERLQAHYVVERALADRVREAQGPEERRRIFATMYDELFRHVPDHPRLLTRQSVVAARERNVRWNLAQLDPYVREGCTFLEIGAGDCALASRVARKAAHVHAVDISDQTRGATLPHNVELAISDGRSIPVPEGSVDVAFSDQLMEHLHPEDALAQLQEIHRVLRPGAVYVCITPNRLYGPSDISGHFEDVARGFHLREYTLGEIRSILAAAGFAKLHVYVGARGCYVRCPSRVVGMLEAALGLLPTGLRRRLARFTPLRAILGLRVAAIKDGP